MSTTVSRWGNSLAIRIPSQVAQKAELSQGDTVQISVTRRGRVVLESIPNEPDFGALYKLISPQNRHDEVKVGPARGNEDVTW